jgi:hypothetical protein
MKSCFSCIWSFGTYEHLRDQSSLKCWPNGDRDKEQLAKDICCHWVREVGADEHEDTAP